MITGFELLLERLGWELRVGSRKAFSSYDNSHRVWWKGAEWINVGLFRPAHVLYPRDNFNYTTQIGIMTRRLELQPLPAEEQYQTILNSIP